VLLALINVLCERAVYDLRVTSCPTSRVADVTAVDPSSLGYVSNTLGVARGPCGRSSCPWLVRGVPGQRVELSLVVLGHLRYHDNCASVIVAEPTDMYYVHIYLLYLLYLAYLLSHFYIKFLLPKVLQSFTVCLKPSKILFTIESLSHFLRTDSANFSLAPVLLSMSVFWF